MGWSNVTWMFRVQTSVQICRCKKSQSSLFILDNKKRTFYLKGNDGKLWVEVIIVSFRDAVSSDRRCPQSKLYWTCTRTVHFAKLNSSSRFESINKLDSDSSYWQILSLDCLLKYHVTSLSSHQSKARSNVASIVNKVYCRHFAMGYV